MNSEIENEKVHLEKNGYEKLGIPGKIKIGDYWYTYKNKIKTDHILFTYRCSNTSCRNTINLDKTNIDKLLNKDNIEDAIYTQKNELKCKINIIKITEKSEYYNTETNIIKKTKNIILENPIKSVFYHQNKLKENNIILDDKKV